MAADEKNTTKKSISDSSSPTPESPPSPPKQPSTIIPTMENGPFLALRTTPSSKVTREERESAYNRTFTYRNEAITRFRKIAKEPKKLTADDLANLFYVQGVTPDKLAMEIAMAKNLTAKEKDYLSGIVDTLADLKAEDPTRSAVLEQAAGNPDVRMEYYAEDEPVPTTPEEIVYTFDRVDYLGGEDILYYSSPPPEPPPIPTDPLPIQASSKTVATSVDQGIKDLYGKVGERVIGKGAQIKGTEAAVRGFTGAAGKAAGPVGIAASLAASKAQRFAGKAIETLTGEKDKRKQAMYVSMATMAIGGVTGMPLVMAGGLLGLVASGTAAGAGFVTTAAGIAGIISVFLAGLGITLVGAIIWSLITIVGIFLFVVFTLIIINSGAYLTPPGSLTQAPPGDIQSPFIHITKQAISGTSAYGGGPSLYFDNSDLPATVTFTITITASQDTLQNISYDYTCIAIQQGANIPCPSWPPSIPVPPVIISPADPVIITYTITIPANTYADSIIIDTFTVTADAGSAGTVTSSVSASIIIGTAPVPTGSCFEIINPTRWPPAYLANIQAAITRLTNDHPRYMAKICASRDIPLCYDPTPSDWWGCHNHRGSTANIISLCGYSNAINPAECDIGLFSGGLGSVLNAEFILTHETGHHLHSINYPLYATYLAYPGRSTEPSLCSYSGTIGKVWERFAEAIALYGSEKPFACFHGSFQSRYPVHYQFARTVVFEE